MTGVDTPKGWDHDSGYHLNADGARLTYVAGPYTARIESMTSDDEVRYVVLLTRETPEGDTEEVSGPTTFLGKGNAKKMLKEAMLDVQAELAAPTMYAPEAYRFGGGRGGEVSGIDHDGGRYCIDCARDHDDIDVDKYIHDPMEVRSGGPVFTDSETQMQHHCAGCQRRIQMTLLSPRP